jgi:hypothetical protein
MTPRISSFSIARELDACIDLGVELCDRHVRFMPSVDRDDAPAG